MIEDTIAIDTVRASRAGHTFHERWAARRSLQLVFPKDDLFAIAVEGLSTNETAEPGDEAADIADLILYYGQGDTFKSCCALQTLQFKYKANAEPVTASYLKKTIEKFASSLLGYEKDFDRKEIDAKLTFSFVTNSDFTDQLWEAVRCLGAGSKPQDKAAKVQYENLKKWCKAKDVEADRLFPLIEFGASTRDLPAQNRKLHTTLSDWTPGVDSQARMRLHGIEELIREKAGLSGQRNNVIKREDVLDSLGCESEDLFPANTEFVDVGTVIEREALSNSNEVIKNATSPVFIYADGGVGKTVFIQSLAQHMGNEFETVIFDCFGGGSYRAVDQARHLPKIGLLQIVNELASRGLCDPQLPSDGDRIALIKAARKRLEQAATAVRTQSSKSGVLVIIDAADNAQLEAEFRNEDDFPSLLLASLSREPVEGVKLVLTARPHRMDAVIGKSNVESLELGAFTEKETRSFLASRRNNLTELEFRTAFARSVGNARVLDYLVSSWGENITGSASKEKITVEELIRQRCEKILNDLHVAGWSDDEVKQFFVAISLLPPPIPLDGMIDALGWPQSKVNSAVADLAPMLELLKHGAIFRDEPTETFIRETYAFEKEAQQDIADSLYARQAGSMYAAEALPHFLVVIDDGERAFALSKSLEYPSSLQSEYGRRRLKLLRLRAAFSLAVKERKLDLVLRLSMQLAQVAAANAKGDEFIRRSPGVSVCVGDQDASRRLFQDRSGWRGARDAMLTVAFAFQDEMDDADIHQHRAIGWINWHSENRQDDEQLDRDGPSATDFASILFLSVLKGDYSLADRNIAKWNFRFALTVCDRLIALIEQYETLHDQRVLSDLVKFVSSKNCRSLALKLSLLASKRSINSAELKQLSRTASTNAQNTKNNAFDNGYDHENQQQSILCNAAISALIHGSRQSASNIIRVTKGERISSYDYSDRHGPFRAWTPILNACVGAWSAAQELGFYHLLPRDVRASREVKLITKTNELSKFLGGLTRSATKQPQKKKNKDRPKKLFSSHDCENIVKGIELICFLAEPLQSSVLARRKIHEQDFHGFIETWKAKLRFDVHWRAEDVRDTLGRNVGLCFAKIFLQHATSVSAEDCQILVEVLSQGRFTISDKLDVILLMARHENLHELTGSFARTISEDIRKDEYIDQRANHYSQLSEALLPLSVTEAQQYFRDGLSQLDQMGGDDYDIIYSLLRYAEEQHGGWLQPNLGHRLMNLCQTIFYHEPSKFGWTLFGSAASLSIGYQSLFKLLRWADQEVSEFSYGLPQLACFLAKNGYLDARRSAYILLLCENQGWHDWKIGEGLSDILEIAKKADRPAIFQVIFSKLLLEHPSGGSEYLWNSLLEAIEKHPGIVDQADLNTLKTLGAKARTQKDDENRRRNAFDNHPPFAGKSDEKDKKQEAEEAFNKIIEDCDLVSPHTIDKAIRAVREDRQFMFNAAKQIIERLRIECPYNKRFEFINLLAELVELDFDDTVEAVITSIESWEDSSAIISSSRKEFVRRIFETKGSELFELSYTGILREIKRLIDFCDDSDFVLHLVLDTVAKEKIELTGDEWLQLATSLCPYASSEANKEALEDLLSGPAARIGDEIGEGPFKEAFAPSENQSSMLAKITWHLLGSEDAFVRWTAARSIKALADLGLHEDLKTLLDCFDITQIDSLVSEESGTSFLNSQQWLLMGLARACFHHGYSLSFLGSRLEKLADRYDLHAINKIHVLRCLKHIYDPSILPSQIKKLELEIYTPAKGYVEQGAWPKPVESKTGFRFDYEFNKHEVSGLGWLFGISEGEARDAIAGEIQKRWPEATDMSYFRGQERFYQTQSERYESYRESVQRHALLNAATKLARTRPLIRSSYEALDWCPWIDWLQRYDITSNNGLWLTDRKDNVPEQAKVHFIARSKGNETLEDDDRLLRKIGVLVGAAEPFLPIHASWRSVDGVSVRVTSALASKKGIIGRCKAFSQEPEHDIWLPSFGSDGEPDRRMRKSDFNPLIWDPEIYSNGVDSGDEFATRYAVERARLGKDLTKRLELEPDCDYREWFARDGSLALRSQVWGQWRPEPSDNRNWFQDDGMVLWASTGWLDSALETLNQTLVLHIDFYRYKSYRGHEDTPGLRATFIGLRKHDGTFRVWKAKQASKAVY